MTTLDDPLSPLMVLDDFLTSLQVPNTDDSVRATVVLPVKWAVTNNFVGQSLAIIEKEGFSSVRSKETDLRRGILRGVRAELQIVR